MLASPRVSAFRSRALVRVNIFRGGKSVPPTPSSLTPALDRYTTAFRENEISCIHVSSAKRYPQQRPQKVLLRLALPHDVFDKIKQHKKFWTGRLHNMTHTHPANSVIMLHKRATRAKVNVQPDIYTK